MRLYLFEHCSLCFRVRMIAALKHLHLQETVALGDDSETMIGLVGKRVIPILVKTDGAPRKTLGDFVELRANSRQYISKLMPDLEELDGLIQSALAINCTLSLDDIRILPLLRSAAVVKGLRFPSKGRDYFETTMNHIGYAPLPVV